LTQLALLATVLVAGPAFADMKIAVLNYQMALLESDAAKKYAVDAEKKFGPQLTKLKALESSAKGIQDRLVSLSARSWNWTSNRRLVTSSSSPRN